MCRVIAYAGRTLLLDVLLYQAECGLVHQVYDPTGMKRLNLAGCGVACWDSGSVSPQSPYIYRNTSLPMYDPNLKRLAQKINTDCAIGHIRGANYMDHNAHSIGASDLHPFQFEGAQVVLAHNGGLMRFADMKFDLLEHIRPEFSKQIAGTTDSEWIYAVLLSQLADPGRTQTLDELETGVMKTLEILREVRDVHGIDTVSGTNLFVSDGTNLLATRFSFDFGRLPSNFNEHQLAYHSLWYTTGDRYEHDERGWRMRGPSNDPKAILIASEPLTGDSVGWIEIPEYTLIKVRKSPEGLEINHTEIML